MGQHSQPIRNPFTGQLMTEADYYDYYEALFDRAVIRMGGDPVKGLGGGLPSGITLEDVEAVMAQIAKEDA